MAVYKSVKGVGKTKSSLYNVLEYVGNKKENEENEKVYKTTATVIPFVAAYFLKFE